MTNSIGQLVLDLKENNEDFEFYPTTDEMLDVISKYLDNGTVLDIGCGTCKFKKYMDKIAKERADEFNKQQDFKELQAQKNGEKFYKNYASIKDYTKISKYYVMEKSKILIEKFDDETICLGTDFNQNTLIDKKVDTIFCNPPYSEFENWVCRIISEGNYKQAFLVIPQRWKENRGILSLLDFYKTTYDILGSFDFLNAERSARAKVDIVRFVKTRNRSMYDNTQKDFDEDAFEGFFVKTFGLEDKREKLNEEDYQTSDRIEKEKVKTFEDKYNLMVSEGKSKASTLVEMYNEEYTTLINHLNSIMQLDSDVMETFGLSLSKIKEGLKIKIKGLKEFYWRKVFDELDEIKQRLTSKTRNQLFNKYSELFMIDFNIENIYAMLLWVIKISNKYYNSQLIDFFKDLTRKENVRPYKSNQKVFEDENFRFNRNEAKNYVLDYRIILSNFFRTYYSGSFCDWDNRELIDDICTIANNLGFEPIWKCHRKIPENYGEKYYIYCMRKKDGILFEYKVYRNGNTHIRFNKEFMKAMNVEVSRLLGWIRCKEDIAREFPEELAKGAEKYFKTNYNCLGCNMLMLTTSKKDEE